MPDPTGYAPIAGARLYYECRGEGMPLVLLHTGNGDTTIWDGQFEDLAADYRVVRYDMRGFGRSSYPPEPYLAARDLAGLLGYLGVERAHIIGPSLGGRVAVEFCLLYPSMAASLLLAAPVLREHAWSAAIMDARIAEDEAFQAGDFDSATVIMMRNWVTGPHRGIGDMDPDLIRRIRVTQRRSYLTRAQTIKEAGAEPEEEELARPVADRLSELSGPAMVLIGGLDAPDPIAIGERLAREIPAAGRHVFEDSGHMITMEQPASFMDAARAFLKSTVNG